MKTRREGIRLINAYPKVCVMRNYELLGKLQDGMEIGPIAYCQIHDDYESV